MQVPAQGDDFLKTGENTYSSPLARASDAVVLCPGICLSLGEHPDLLLLTAPTRSIDFFLSQRESKTQALNYLNYLFSRLPLSVLKGFCWLVLKISSFLEEVR